MREHSLWHRLVSVYVLLGRIAYVPGMRPSEWLWYIKLAVFVTFLAIMWVVVQAAAYMVHNYGWWTGFVAGWAIIAAGYLYDYRNRRRQRLPPR